MVKIKYIYFEINQITGYNATEKRVENENILLIKPDTNSSGVWGYTNITRRYGFPEPLFSVVNQYWIDLQKFEKEEHEVYSDLKKHTVDILKRLNQKLDTDE